MPLSYPNQNSPFHIVLALLGYIILDSYPHLYPQQAVFLVDALATTSYSKKSFSKNGWNDRKKDTNKIIKEKSDILPSIQIRSTIETDIPNIVDLLAFEASKTQAQPGQQQQRPVLFGNWNMSMKKLKSEASLTSQLTHRLEAKQHASNVIQSYMKQHKQQESANIIKKDDLRYLLWKDDTFRSKLSKAVKITSTWEGTIWDDWNFAITPDSKMLHHFMLTVTDDEFVGFDDDDSPGVVGFCEVGICHVPTDYNDFNQDRSSYNDDEDGRHYVPCIGNLVISPNHRRRGIGKKLIQSVIRLLNVTSHQYSGNNGDSNNNTFNNSLGLYVDEDNVSAISLYQGEGFVVAGRCDEHEKGRLFMVLNISSQNGDCSYLANSRVDEKTLTLN